MCEFRDNGGILRGLRFAIPPTLLLWSAIVGIAYLVRSVWQ